MAANGEVAQSQVLDTRTAAKRWAARELGAPRGFEDHITGVEDRDEVLTRIATEIHHRQVFEQRAPGPKGRRGKRTGITEDVKPWEVTLDDLRRDTEFVDQCVGCAGAGTAACGGCSGSGRARCGNCGGSGQVWKQLKNSRKQIQCAVCHAAGTVRCSGCGGSGKLTCPGCGGNGNQLAWWAYTELVRPLVEVLPESPILSAHPQLREPRVLAEADLQPFAVLNVFTAAGELDRQDLDEQDRRFYEQRAPKLDPRLERAAQQQLIRFGVPRRDATYDLCGTTGTVVFSGKHMAGSRSQAALRPIQIRRWTWAIGGGLASFVILIVCAGLRGTTAYFDQSNTQLMLLGLVASAFAVVDVGAITRILRPGFRFRAFRAYEYATLGALGLSLVLIVTLHFTARPTAKEAEKVIASGDLKRAAVVVDALASVPGDKTQLANVKDELELATARTLSGDDKLAKLDPIAARGGPLAASAADDARAERKSLFDGAIASKDVMKARAILDTWPKRSDDDAAQIGELRAKTYEAELEACSDDVCRWSSARNAATAAPTSERTGRATTLRTALLNDLSLVEKADEPPAERLARIRKLGALAKSAAAIGNDDEVTKKAQASMTWAHEERAKVALIGAPQAVVTELLEAPADASKKNSEDVSQVTIAWSIGPADRCVGVYLTGNKKGERKLSDSTHAATTAALLAQAVGHDMKLPDRPKENPNGSASATSRDGAVPITARWYAADLIELRIGEATP